MVSATNRQIRRQREPVFIIGAHRSGTTATVRALELLGLVIGERLDSHHEPYGLQRLHEQYLHRLGAAWHAPAPFLGWIQTPEGRDHCSAFLGKSVRREFGSTFGYPNNLRGLWLRARLKLGQPWGWKEPRTTLFARCWLKIFPAARIVHVIRHPLAVAISIRQRELAFRKAGDPATGKLDDLNYCLRLVSTYIECGEALAADTPHFQRVRFEDIQADPKKSLAQLAGFCGLQVTPAELNSAAGSIRPKKPDPWDGLSGETVRDLFSKNPIVTELGYRLENGR